MPAPFARTLRAVETDGAMRRWWSVTAALLLVGLWAMWFFAVKVTVYETSRAARLEADSAIHPVSSVVGGRVTAIHLQLNAFVESGAVLVELDCEKERRRLDEEKRRLAGLRPQIESIRRQMVTTEEVIKLSRVGARSAADGARARKEEAETASHFAADEAARFTKAAGHLPDLEILRARAEADKQQAAVRAVSLDVERLENDQRTHETEARARIEALRHDLANAESQLATTSAAIDVLAQDVERHVIRAPVAGRIGAVAPTLQLGAFVKEGEQLGAIVPAGTLRVAADFTPQDAIGRLREGQSARLRLHGFPWTQFGSVRARVTSVESEPRDGASGPVVRVELAVVSAPPAVPMQHGLPGTLEVEVERATPATLLLRACGRMVAAPSVRE
jgi:membrane fusion protein (multidrug efflux system)